jgi:hypothetical protein
VILGCIEGKSEFTSTSCSQIAKTDTTSKQSRVLVPFLPRMVVTAVIAKPSQLNLTGQAHGTLHNQPVQ